MYIGAYLPTNSNNYDNFKKALEELRKQNTKWKKKIPNFLFIMAGDLNIDKKHSKERKRIFEQFTQSIGGYHWIPSYEHAHWKTKSYLDVAIISENIAVSGIWNVTESQVSGNRSDHEPVLFKFIKTEKVKKQKPKSERKDDPRFFHTKKADWGRINKEKYEALESLEKHKREIG